MDAGPRWQHRRAVEVEDLAKRSQSRALSPVPLRPRTPSKQLLEGERVHDRDSQFRSVLFCQFSGDSASSFLCEKHAAIAHCSRRSLAPPRSLPRGSGWRSSTPVRGSTRKRTINLRLPPRTARTPAATEMNWVPVGTPRVNGFPASGSVGDFEGLLVTTWDTEENA